MTEFESALVVMGSVSGVVLLAVLISLFANWVRDKSGSVKSRNNKGKNVTTGKF